MAAQANNNIKNKENQIKMKRNAIAKKAMYMAPGLVDGNGNVTDGARGGGGPGAGTGGEEMPAVNGMGRREISIKKKRNREVSRFLKKNPPAGPVKKRFISSPHFHECSTCRVSI